MSEKKNDFRFVNNVRVKVSSDQKWLRHILPDEKITISISMKYYRKIFEAYLQRKSEEKESEKLNE